MAVAKGKGMNPHAPVAAADMAENTIPFWSHLVALDELRDCAPLEKLLVGCEIIAALDDTELLAA